MSITTAPNIAHCNSVTLEPKARLESVVFTGIQETEQHPELRSETHHYVETLIKESVCHFSSIKGQVVPCLSLRDEVLPLMQVIFTIAHDVLTESSGRFAERTLCYGM